MTRAEVVEYLQGIEPHQRLEAIELLRQVYEDMSIDDIIRAVDTKGRSIG